MDLTLNMIHLDTRKSFQKKHFDGFLVHFFGLTMSPYIKDLRCGLPREEADRKDRGFQAFRVAESRGFMDDLFKDI